MNEQVIAIAEQLARYARAAIIVGDGTIPASIAIDHAERIIEAMTPEQRQQCPRCGGEQFVEAPTYLGKNRTSCTWCNAEWTTQ